MVVKHIIKAWIYEKEYYVYDKFVHLAPYFYEAYNDYLPDRYFITSRLVKAKEVVVGEILLEYPIQKDWITNVNGREFVIHSITANDDGTITCTSLDGYEIIENEGKKAEIEKEAQRRNHEFHKEILYKKIKKVEENNKKSKRKWYKLFFTTKE